MVDGAIVIREEEEEEGDDKKYSDTIHQINYIFGELAGQMFAKTAKGLEKDKFAMYESLLSGRRRQPTTMWRRSRRRSSVDYVQLDLWPDDGSTDSGDTLYQAPVIGRQLSD